MVPMGCDTASMADPPTSAARRAIDLVDTAITEGDDGVRDQIESLALHEVRVLAHNLAMLTASMVSEDAKDLGRDPAELWREATADVGVG